MNGKGVVLLSALGTAAGIAMCIAKRVLAKPRVALKGKEAISLQLTKIEPISHNSRVFHFALPHPSDILGLPIGQHVSLVIKDDTGKTVSRPYTPISSDHDIGALRLAVKVYPEGKMSQHLDKMAVGDFIDVKGPTGRFTYEGRGKCNILRKGKFTAKKFGMIAGGTGITPMLQIMEAIYRDPEDKTEVSLIFANQTEEDILLREFIEGLVEARPKQFKVWMTLDRPGCGWTQGKGFVTKDMISEHLPPPEDEPLIMCCGPPGMLKYACEPNLNELGYSRDLRFTF